MRIWLETKMVLNLYRKVPGNFVELTAFLTYFSALEKYTTALSKKEREEGEISLDFKHSKDL